MTTRRTIDGTTMAILAGCVLLCPGSVSRAQSSADRTAGRVQLSRFTESLARLAKSAKTSIVLDDLPSERKESTDRFFESSSTDINAFCKAFDYAVVKQDTGILILRKRYVRPDEHPTVTPEEAYKVVTIVRRLIPDVRPDTNHVYWPQTIVKLSKCLLPPQIGALNDGAKLAAADLTSSQRQLLRQVINERAFGSAAAYWTHLADVFHRPDSWRLVVKPAQGVSTNHLATGNIVSLTYLRANGDTGIEEIGLTERTAGQVAPDAGAEAESSKSTVSSKPVQDLLSNNSETTINTRVVLGTDRVNLGAKATKLSGLSEVIRDRLNRILEVDDIIANRPIAFAAADMPYDALISAIGITQDLLVSHEPDRIRLLKRSPRDTHAGAEIANEIQGQLPPSWKSFMGIRDVNTKSSFESPSVSTIPSVMASVDFARSTILSAYSGTSGQLPTKPVKPNDAQMRELAFVLFFGQYPLSASLMHDDFSFHRLSVDSVTLEMQNGSLLMVEFRAPPNHEMGFGKNVVDP